MLGNSSNTTSNDTLTYAKFIDCYDDCLNDYCNSASCESSKNRYETGFLDEGFNCRNIYYSVMKNKQRTDEEFPWSNFDDCDDRVYNSTN